MTSKKMIHYIRELQDIQQLAVESARPVTLQSLDGSVVVDAKSYIGMYGLDFSQPVLVVSDDAGLHEKIKGIGTNLSGDGDA